MGLERGDLVHVIFCRFVQVAQTEQAKNLPNKSAPVRSPSGLRTAVPRSPRPSWGLIQELAQRNVRKRHLRGDPLRGRSRCDPGEVIATAQRRRLGQHIDEAREDNR